MSLYTLAISPCPNDTFIFSSLIAGNETLKVRTCLYDIAQLNQYALQKKFDIIKVSYGILPQLLKDYTLLTAGSALGRGVGPLVVADKPIDWSDKRLRILSPGVSTTAHYLFDLFYPGYQKVPALFSEIEDKLLQKEADAGIIIHESRFTYAQKGLKKIADLGELWEQRFHLPLPLGGIVVRKSLSDMEKSKIQAAVRSSLADAQCRYPQLDPYVRRHAQAMEPSVMRQHIKLYVNRYSECLDAEALAAIRVLCQIPEDRKDWWWESVLFLKEA